MMVARSLCFMSVSSFCAWFKGFVIVLLVCALIMVFLPFPGRAFADWLMFALGLCAAALVAVLAFCHVRNGQGTVRNFLFDDQHTALLWLVVRVYLGSVWLQNGLAKVVGSGWTNGGSALKTFWLRAVNGPAGGRSPIPYAWYRDLLHLMLVHHIYTWFAWVITISEVTIGLLLLLGLCTGLAACAGGVLNLLYLLAGSISVNPVMLILSLFLLFAWRVAGYYGLDRFLLPAMAQRFTESATPGHQIFEFAPWLLFRRHRRQMPVLTVDTPNRFR